MNIEMLIDTLDTFVDKSKMILNNDQLSHSNKIADITSLAKTYGLWDDVTVNS